MSLQTREGLFRINGAGLASLPMQAWGQGNDCWLEVSPGVGEVRSRRDGAGRRYGFCDDGLGVCPVRERGPDGFGFGGCYFGGNDGDVVCFGGLGDGKGVVYCGGVVDFGRGWWVCWLLMGKGMGMWMVGCLLVAFAIGVENFV